jgi:putative ABC transport system permease protein
VIWIRGLLAHRRGPTLAVAVGVAVTVALLASIGAFLGASSAQMTERAIRRVPLDWQVEAQPGADPAAVTRAVRSFPAVRRALPVGYARTPGLATTAGGSTQTTGPGWVLGLPQRYATTFPGELRPLAGASTGVLLFQQTAANLHATPGDTVLVGRAGLPPVRVRVDGVVDLPALDSLFQKVGAPTGAQPQAPPDNVLLLPETLWRRAFAPLAHRRPDLVRYQAHARLDHALPRSPAAAYVQVSGLARNLETRLAGAGLVGDNLGTALAAARSDSLYAQVLFLFLGLPGAILAALVTGSIAAAGAARRRGEQGLLRARGADTAALVRVALAEAALVGSAGVAAGLGAALLLGRLAFGSSGFGAGSGSAIGWSAGAALVGLAVAAAAIAVPAWSDARALTVSAARREVGRARPPRWLRFGLDAVLLGVGAALFYATSRNGYKLVLAVEGIPTVSVNYYALLGPLFVWVGFALLAYRLAYSGLGRGGGLVARAVRPLAGTLADTVAATMGRQRRRLAWAVMLVGVTAAFAGSTATFNATYRQQAEVDALLSNGADVVVTEPPGSSVGAAGAGVLTRVAGVRSVEPLQHRFAYVGADLQDLFGVRPQTIVQAGRLQDAYFAGGSATSLFAELGRRPDALLVSAETVRDFQLSPGDRLNLRLQDGRTKRYTTVPFTYVGVAKEFPTAPSDSFLVANASYVARRTGTDAVGAFLVQTGSASPGAVRARIAARLGATAAVTDIASDRKVIGSSLTAVELSGLTKLELGFALVLAAAATGLALALGLAERRRTFAIASALGATPRQLGGFVWSEAAFVTVGGLVLGALGGSVLTAMLVKVLTGVFDPPPSAVAVPWLYLGSVLAVACAAVVVAAAGTIRTLRRPALESLREL